ncbi:MAG: tRNA 2-thiouridine(34) synthase MnmA [Patescibacteria group bacterium]|nr:MAG: tRNA 2-thiouridine(34) synthase MnmA [Patescibacteria group bacterium]
MGISGGVDSAVAAALLKEQGYEVIGVHLYCFDEGPWCTASEDRVSAVRVAEHLGIPLLVWDLRKQYRSKVVNYFFKEYRAGRTPNPDIVCNREIKFGIFLEKALEELGADYVATGHYARIARSEQRTANSEQQESREPLTVSHKLLRGVDESKDQSYFLYTLTQKQLGHILFPIGELTKKEVRKIAADLDLPNKDRPDSQGICFIGPVDVGRFLREHLPKTAGPVVSTKGEVIGEHDGVWFFTEGQRRGFRVFKPGYPLYVIRKDLKTNILVVGRGKESAVRKFVVEDVSWVGAANPSGLRSSNPKGLSDGFFLGKVGVRIRHLGEIMPATLKSADSGSLVVTLTAPTRGVAPGQSAVFYRGEEVLGGGVIEKTG